MNERSLYEKLGGEQAVIKLVDSFYARVLNDELLAEFFKDTPMQQLKNMQKELFTIALGGPGEYSGLNMSRAHQGRGIYARHFKAFVQHLLDTLGEHGLSEEERYQIITEINHYVGDIADDSAAPLG